MTNLCDMQLGNEVVLRPRFKIEMDRSNDDALQTFDRAKAEQKEFVVTRVDDHVFIKLPREKQHFWSPQLHLEIMETGENKSTLHGLFGPNPTVWTLFMFLHFIVIGLFIAFGIWAYTNWSLDTSYAMQMTIALLMIVVWFALYFAGRMGKSTGKEETILLHNFMKRTLKL